MTPSQPVSTISSPPFREGSQVPRRPRLCPDTRRYLRARPPPPPGGPRATPQTAPAPPPPPPPPPQEVPLPIPSSSQSPLPTRSSRPRGAKQAAGIFSAPHSYLGHHETIRVLGQEPEALFVRGAHFGPPSKPGPRPSQLCGVWLCQQAEGGQPLPAAPRSSLREAQGEPRRITADNPLSLIKGTTRLQGARGTGAQSFCPCCAHSPKPACTSHLPPPHHQLRN